MFFGSKYTYNQQQTKAKTKKEPRSLAKELVKHGFKYGLNKAGSRLDPITGAFPDALHFGFSLGTIIVPALNKHVPEKLTITDPIWSAADGVAQAVCGLNQLIYPGHRKVFTRIKGALNLISGLQQVTFTGVSYAKYGTPSFMVGSGVSLVISLMDTVEVALRRYSFDYWLSDRKARYLQIQSDLKELTEVIEWLKKTKGEQGLTDKEQWLLNAKLDKKEELLEQKEKCIDDMVARSVCHWRDGKIPSLKILHSEQFFEKSEQSDELKRDFEASIGRHKRATEYSSFHAYHKRNAEISRKLKSKFVKNAQNTVLQAVIFTGFLLACFIAPPLHLAALILIGASILWIAADRTKPVVSAGHEKFKKWKKDKDESNNNDIPLSDPSYAIN